MLLASAIETSCSCKSISIFLRRQACLLFLNTTLKRLCVRLNNPEADNKPYLRTSIKTAFGFHITYEAGSEALILPKQMCFRGHSLTISEVLYYLTWISFRRNCYDVIVTIITLLRRHDGFARNDGVCVRGRCRLTGVFCISNDKQFEWF
jgi:hypothetical protein